MYSPGARTIWASSCSSLLLRKGSMAQPAVTTPALDAVQLSPIPLSATNCTFLTPASSVLFLIRYCDAEPAPLYPSFLPDRSWTDLMWADFGAIHTITLAELDQPPTSSTLGSTRAAIYAAGAPPSAISTSPVESSRNVLPPPLPSVKSTFTPCFLNRPSPAGASNSAR